MIYATCYVAEVISVAFAPMPLELVEGDLEHHGHRYVKARRKDAESDLTESWDGYGESDVAQEMSLNGWVPRCLTIDSRQWTVWEKQ